MIEILTQTKADEAAIEQLMDEVFGMKRHSRTVWLLRTAPPVANLCLVLRDADVIVASIQFWEIRLDQQIILLLGPLAVRPDLRGRGYGRRIVLDSLARARKINKWPLALVSGEPDYYPKFGFVPASPYQLQWPGFVEPERLQILELKKGVLATLRPPMCVRARVV